ncbi:MAG: TlpA family protein disulfide reductase [Acidobacteriia bacterium]|nr:TlpA family protein disulfide reductase [Terriglobia bacterium]
MRTFLTALLCSFALLAADAPRPAQRFLLPDVQGHDHDSYEYKGKAMVLEFMQTGCVHCAAFSNVLKQVQARYGPQIHIVALVNPPDTPANVSKFTAEHQINYPILLDAGRVAYAYIGKPAFDLPYIFLIDARGQIREQFEYGLATHEIFEGNALFPHIEALLGASFGGAGKK